MKIERLNENQIKFILNENDLIERNIKISELAYGSEKTQALFREMLEQALYECDFEVDNIPLMIEAIPMTSDSITIIVTKVNHHSQIEEKFNLKPTNKEKINTTKSGSVIDTINNNISIFSFETLDEVTDVCYRLKHNFIGKDMLFKYNNKYYLYLENFSKEHISTHKLDLILTEYAVKHISSEMSKNYLLEHGEVIVKNNVINIFSEYLA